MISKYSLEAWLYFLSILLIILTNSSGVMLSSIDAILIDSK